LVFTDLTPPPTKIKRKPVLKSVIKAHPSVDDLIQHYYTLIIKQVASNKSSLLLKFILQNTQTLQLN
jgi:hypothetical protein